MSTFADAALGRMKVAKEEKRKKQLKAPEEGRTFRKVLTGVGGASLGGLGGAALGGAAGAGINALLGAMARRGGAAPMVNRQQLAALEQAAAHRILTGMNLGLGAGAIGGALGGAALSQRADDHMDEISSNAARGALIPLAGSAAAMAGLAGANFGPRYAAPMFFSAAHHLDMAPLMAISGAAHGLGAGVLKAFPELAPVPEEKKASYAGRRDALQKLALFDGASEPEYLHREAIPYETRKQHLQEYLNAKAVEAKEPMGPAVLRGALTGGLAGAIPGALIGSSIHPSSPGIGALLGAGALGLGGAGLGALVNWGRADQDHYEIDEARRLHKDPSAVDRALVERVHAAIAAREAEEDNYRDEMLTHARRQSYRDESDRYGRRHGRY